MKKLFACLMVLVLCTAMVTACLAEQGEIGILTQLGVSEDELNENLKDILFNVMPFSGFKYFETFNSLISALNSGTIEAIEADEYVSSFLFSRMEGFTRYIPDGLPEYRAGYSMLLREDDVELRDLISGVILEMQEDGTLEALKAQYIDDVVAGNEPEAVVPEHFEGAETLRIALTGDRPPMDYFSADDEPLGFNTALVTEIAKRLQLNVEFVSVDAGARAVALASKTSDVIFWSEVGDFNNWEKANAEDQPENTIVTPPYLTGTLYYIVRADSPLVNK